MIADDMTKRQLMGVPRDSEEHEQGAITVVTATIPMFTLDGPTSTVR